MKSRSLCSALAVCLVVSTVSGAVGCARKIARSAPQPPASPSATQEPRGSSPLPSPTGPTAAIEQLVPVYYGYDSYAFDDQARAALDRNAKSLRDAPDLRVTIEGHCDERGSVEYNQALGERRARAARDYLTEAGVELGRIEFISYGKERPFDERHDEAAWAANRRAHFVVR